MSDNERTRLDIWLSRLRNRPIVAAIILFVMVVVGLGTLTDALDKIVSFSRHFYSANKLKPEELEQIRRAVNNEFPERLLDSLVRNTHSRELFPDEIREVLASVIDPHSPSGFKRLLYKSDDNLKEEFKNACTSLSDFIFTGYGEKYGLNGDGDAIVNSHDMRAELRPHIAKQGNKVIMITLDILKQKD